jgi:hypothetical protein
MTATHVNVTRLTASSENLGHKPYRDNFFSPLALFEDLHTKTINCCGTISSNRKGTIMNFTQKVKLKQGDIKTRERGNLTAILWKDKI